MAKKTFENLEKEKKRKDLWALKGIFWGRRFKKY